MYPPARSAFLNSLEYVTSCILESVLFDLSRLFFSDAIMIILPNYSIQGLVLTRGEGFIQIVLKFRCFGGWGLVDFWRKMSNSKYILRIVNKSRESKIYLQNRK